MLPGDDAEVLVAGMSREMLTRPPALLGKFPRVVEEEVKPAVVRDVRALARP